MSYLLDTNTMNRYLNQHSLNITRKIAAVNLEDTIGKSGFIVWT